MKIAFVYTNINGFHSDLFSFGLSTIVGVAKKAGHDVRVLLVRQREDYARIVDEIAAFAPRVVGFSSVSSQFCFVKELAALIKQRLPQTLTVCGGVHPTINPRCVERAEALDAVFVGEAEEAFGEFLSKVAAGQAYQDTPNLAFVRKGLFVKNPLKPLIADLDAVPFPDRDSLLFAETLKAVGYAPFFFSRGCPYLCTYCSNHAIAKCYGLTRNRPRFRSPENCIREIEDVVNRFPVPKIGIIDDIFGIDKAWRREFCRKYQERVGIRFFCLLRANLIDEEFVRLLKAAGCYRISIGVESGNEHIRNTVMKRALTTDQIVNAFAVCRRAGIQTNALNIIGTPGETEEMIWDTIKLNRRIRPTTSGVNIFYPYRGTQLGDECFAQGMVDEALYSSFSDERRSSVLKYPEEFKARLVYYKENWEDLVNRENVSYRFKKAVKAILKSARIWDILVSLRNCSIPRRLIENTAARAQMMTICLSCIPKWLLRAQGRPVSGRRWVYFGTCQKTLKRLRRQFQDCGQEVAYGELLHEKSKAVRGRFVSWLEAMGTELAGQREWLFSAPAVRNTYTSDLFLNVCYFEVFQDLLNRQDPIDLVFVDSPALAGCLQRTFPSQAALVFGHGIFNAMAQGRFWLRSCLRYGRYLLDYGLRFVAAKIVLSNRSKHLITDNDKVVLIRNFISGTYVDTDQDILERHFFPGLYRYLDELGCTPVFLPVIIKPTNYFRLFREVLAAKKKIVFAEEFLQAQDYVFAFSLPFRAGRLSFRPPEYEGHDLGPLLKEDFRRNLTSAEFLCATLLSCLGPRLKQDRWQPQWMINWTENQAFEKGILWGMKAAFPRMPVIGAQPFIVPPNYLAPVFTRQERAAGLLPDRLLTLGPLWKDAVAEFVRDVPTDYSPAFRYSSALTSPPVPAGGNDLLVLLGINQENSVFLMQMLLDVAEGLRLFDRVIVKLHPAAPFTRQTLAAVIKERFPESFEFVTGRLESYLDRAAVGFCGASGTAVELVMRGIPVVTIGETHSLTMNYLDYKADADMWRICFRSEQVLDALRHFRALRTRQPEGFQEKAEAFRRDFIAEEDSGYWENLLIKA